MRPSGKTEALIVILVILLVGLGVSWYIFRTDLPSIRDTPPDMQVTASDFILELSDESGSTNHYKPNQIVEIFGRIKEMNTLNNRQTIIMNGAQDKSPYIICDLKPGQDSILSRLNAGDTIHIKGLFKGYLKDAVLLHCVLTYYNADE